MNKNQYGFSVVEGLVIVLIVGLAGLIGLYIMNHQTVPKEAKNTHEALAVKSQPKSYFLKYEKLTFEYPGNWTLKSAPGSVYGQLSSDYDSATITAPSNLQIVISTGMFFVEHPAYDFTTTFKVVSSEPLKTLGGTYYLNGVELDDGTMRNLCLSQSAKPPIDGSHNPSNLDFDWPVGKNITLTQAQPEPVGHKTFISLCVNMNYPDKPNTKLSAVQEDNNYTAAKQVIESMHY